MASVVPTVFISFLLALTCSISQSTADGDNSVEATQVGKPKVLKLDRQSVILPKVAPRAGKQKNFYSAKIKVGEPGQEFHVSFDLSGGTVVLPAESCTDPACRERRRYDHSLSGSSEDIQHDGQLVPKKRSLSKRRHRDHGSIDLHSLDVGSGKAEGVFVRDQVCVGMQSALDDPDEARCFPLAMLIANSLKGAPLALEPYDGTVGLGLDSLSLSKEFNFLASFHTGYKEPVLYPNSFGLHIGSDQDGGEITLGGYDASRLTHPLQWAPVAEAQEGRWQVEISAIRVGNNTLDMCKQGTCRAAIDYSSSLLAVPQNIAPRLEKVLAFESSPSGFGDGCQYSAVPDINLELSSGITLTLPSEDFVSEFGSSKAVTLKPSCEPLLTHYQDDVLGKDLFILGEATLRRYYTFFNADTLSVGFSLAAGSVDKISPDAAKTEANARRKAKASRRDGETVVVLVQMKFVKSKSAPSTAI